jgi:hypothetical protein
VTEAGPKSMGDVYDSGPRVLDLKLGLRGKMPVFRKFVRERGRELFGGVGGALLYYSG